MHAAATLGARAVAGARGHARMRKSEPVNVTKKFFVILIIVVWDENSALWFGPKTDGT